MSELDPDVEPLARGLVRLRAALLHALRDQASLELTIRDGGDPFAVRVEEGNRVSIWNTAVPPEVDDDQ